MSVRIPDDIGIDAPRTAPARAAPAINPGDWGLGQAREALQRATAAYQQQADTQATTAYAQAQTDFDSSYIPAAKAYGQGDGAPEPGFAAAQLAARDQVFAAASKGLSPAARQRFDQLSVEHRVATADHALSTEATAQQHWAETQRNAADAAGNAAVLSDVQVATHQNLAAGLHDDATDPGFAAGQLQSFDARAAGALEQVTERARPALQQQLASQRANLQLQLAGMATHQAEAATQLKTSQAFTTLRNTVAGDPSFLDTALKQAPVALQALPTEQRNAAVDEAPGALMSAAVKGRLDAQDYDGARALLARPDAKANMPSAFYAQAQQAVTSFDISRTRALQGAEMQPALEANLASIQRTGVATDFDLKGYGAAFGPAEGPAKMAEAARAIDQARQVYALTGGNFQAMAPADQDARLAAAKPAPGDGDFAVKQAVYDAAVKQRDQQRQELATDPARGVTADRTLAETWRQAQTGDAAKMQAWAGATLGRQQAIGVSPADQRILPTAEAKRLAALVDKSGPRRAEALEEVAGYAARYGVYGPRVLGELAQNGLDRTDATVLIEAGGDPVAIGQYARGKERGAALKLDPGQGRQLGDAVTAAMRPLAATFAADPGGPAHADALHDAVETAAKGFIAEGVSPVDAAHKAATAYLGRYAVTDGWRMDAALAQRPATVTDVTASGGRSLNAGITSGAGTVTRTVPARQAVQLGGQRVVSDLTGGGGAGLYPRGEETTLTPAQKQARYADVVANRGRWATTPDDAGLQLVIPSPAGGMTPVLDKGGRPVIRRFGDLLTRAAGKP